MRDTHSMVKTKLRYCRSIAHGPPPVIAMMDPTVSSIALAQYRTTWVDKRIESTCAPLLE